MSNADGKESVDLVCGGAVLGRNRPELATIGQGSIDEARKLLTDALVKRLGHESVHYTASASEAVDGALKLAYAATRRAAVLHLEKSHHGLTLGALSVMGAERLRAAFPSIPGNEMVPFGDLERAEAKLKTKKFAAVIVEPIQYEAGIRVCATSYLSGLAALAKKYGTLLICDEANTGFGRSGALFAHRALGVIPDVISFSNAITNGVVALGGYSCSADWSRRAQGRHEDADVDHELAFAIARRALELIDEPLLERVRQLGEHLGARLAAVRSGTDTVAEVRGKGLLWGIELAPPTKGLARLLTLGLPNAVAGRLFGQWLVVRLREKGVVLRTAAHDPNVLLVAPALVSLREEIDRFATTLEETLEENDRFVKWVRDEGQRLVTRTLKASS